MLSDYALTPMFLALRYGYPCFSPWVGASIWPEIRYGEVVLSYPPRQRVTLVSTV